MLNGEQVSKNDQDVPLFITEVLTSPVAMLRKDAKSFG
jgi:hypothetical protein